jgi:D-beta-D-heptose 7-phosphate kinase/D-beta-D-heptose 1-phosphate adenosyltransferase
MNDRHDLAGHLDALTGAPVLVVGDVMLDRFVYGTVERISPEGPIPVLRIERQAATLGGAGNVLRNLAAAGARTTFVAAVGEDEAGREVQDLVAAEAGVTSHVVVDPGRPTSIKERYIASGQQLLRTDRETQAPIGAAGAAALQAAAKAALGGVAAVVLSDYGKGVLQPETLAELIAAARAAGRPVVVDPKGHDFGVYRGADLVTPNRRELQNASGLPTTSDAEVEAACRALIAACGVEGVLATRSEAGMTLVLASGGVHHFPTEAREVFDVSGAGDTVVALLGAALAGGVPVVEAARLANLAAGIVVARAGTAVARPSEILRAIHAADLHTAEAKVVDLDSLLDRVLRQAQAACDRLIVGLNSDGSVRALKGAGRPVQGEAARAALIAAQAGVDQVVVFSEETPFELIERIRPDVLVKGADYSLDQVVGAELVQGYGGRVLLAELAPGHSTSDTLGRFGG